MHTPARRLSATDPSLTYRGAVSLQEVDGGIAPWRIPFADRALFFPEGGMGRAAMPSGVRVTFVTDATWVRCRYSARPAPEMDGPPVVGHVDVVVDGDLAAGVRLETGGAVGEFLVEGLPGRDKKVELWLPCLNQFVMHGVEVPTDATVRRDVEPAPRWVHYGSSESQGRGALSPSRTWLATVARSLGLDLTSLAIGAGCHLQPLYGSLMRDLPADLLTCCVGINIYGTRSLNEFTYQANLIGLVRSVREKHPTTPFVVMSHHHSPWHDPLETPGVFSLKQVREHTRLAVERLREHGDENLFYLHGPDVFGPEWTALYLEPPGIDPLHFNARGHEIMAEAFQRGLLDLVPGLRPVPARIS
ncbi:MULTISPECIES: GDSL-type esterase/lipase family protein [Streptosporangium]|uniref:Lysophospholipase L1-like esterase n=1 Tax=Streptosporangium brasiliense TaxID=47480 RepID=A0ABT9R360_9ACTN|nr:SGNH/GDSL hydrolase family protein [Streptosporangium brasiliense]MDP9863664.1 lysophospholipase L1-like esterase [Streptosporangium brasiliense]